MRYIFITLVLLFSTDVFSQSSLSRFEQSPSKGLYIGGYAQVDYNQPISKKHGMLDVHRVVSSFGYRFNKKINFFSEIEFEHVKELSVEQAFLTYKINNKINIKSGLLLIPMGIINEYHEPASFNGVERPNTDKFIVPSTWRSIGIGISGRFNEAALKYQLYLVNGFVSYTNKATISSIGLRNGRQKGSKSIINSPNLSVKFDYYGLLGLKLGLAGYFGKTQTQLYQTDSSRVGISMIGIDARYTKKGFQGRGEYIFTSISNTVQYNKFSSQQVGSMLDGYYLEFGYNLLYKQETKDQLIPFIRYEKYDTQKKLEAITKKNDYLIQELTIGLTWKPISNVTYKVDYQFIKKGNKSTFSNQINFGIGLQY